MKYTLQTPCDACPFLRGSGFTFSSLMDHASGEFPCHKACKIDEESDEFIPLNNNTPHCAGALIFLEKRKHPHQMMRIAEKLGFYDMRKLDMAANVGSTPGEYRQKKEKK